TTTDGGSLEGGTADAPEEGAIEAGPKHVALVQKATLVTSGQTSTSTSFQEAVTAGDFVAAIMLTTNVNGGATFSVADTLNHTWSATMYRRCVGDAGIRIWHVESAKPGTMVVTVTQTGGGPLALALVEYAGVGGLDVEASAC